MILSSELRKKRVAALRGGVYLTIITT